MSLPLVLLPCLLGLAQAQGSSTRIRDMRGPGNILILVADDLGIDQLASYGIGPDPAPTPNLDRLAAEGVLFRNVWSQPTCSPTRATLQTGCYGFRTAIGASVNPNSGPALELSEVTLPEMLDLGTGGAYAHAAIGKWHLGNGNVGGDLAPNIAGYSHFAGVLEGQMTSYTYWNRVENGVGSITTRYATSACVDDALTWIKAQRRPWMCMVNFQAPHAPFHRPPSHLHTQDLPPEDPAAVCYAPGPDPLPFYRAMVEALDSEIGRLLEQIPPLELATTTVIFLGDNGTDRCLPLPPFTSRAKGTLYEGGVRVPLLVWGRGIQPGVCAALVNTTDLFATVADLAGVDLAATLPGLQLDSHSFAASLVDPTQGARQWLHAEIFSPIGQGNPSDLPPCPSSDLCQPSIGYDGPGNLTLASCGQPLYGAYGASLVSVQVAGAAPLAPVWLRIGPFAPGFDPGFGVEVVSSVPSFQLGLVADSAGTVESTLWTGNTSDELFYQAIAQDPGQASGFAVSNALQVDLLWTDMRAVRGRRFKLIRFDPCREELYDLQLDPFELQDLLEGTPSPAALAARDRLALILDALR